MLNAKSAIEKKVLTRSHFHEGNRQYIFFLGWGGGGLHAVLQLKFSIFHMHHTILSIRNAEG